jgi:Na+/melibiose symporter-like transporter
MPDAPQALEGFRTCSGIVVGIMFAICTLLLTAYKISKTMTIQMADELAERRRAFAS